MPQFLRLFRIEQPTARAFGWGDGVVLVLLAGAVYGAAYLGTNAPAVVRGPEISLAPSTLPWYAGLSLARMATAYALSVAFSLLYGYAAARRKNAERVLLPLLDVLESVPMLSFLPAVLLGLSAVLPKAIAPELASIVLIFTSQVWNLAFAWYQALATLPQELRDAGEVFRFNGWLRFKTIELPFAMVGLVWNSLMSWAGGWFFLMAAEAFTVGERDFRLPGLGAYLRAAADRGDLRAASWGVFALVLLIVALDQLLWRPLIAWSDGFKLELTESDDPPTSWFYDALRTSHTVGYLSDHLLRPAGDALDDWLTRRFPARDERAEGVETLSWTLYVGALTVGALAAWGAFRALGLLWQVTGPEWARIGLSLGATFLRVAAAMTVALAWTIPVGVVIGTHPRLARWLQAAVQITASVPATALFPVLLLFLLRLSHGLELAAVLLMLLGAQWYLLFNIIAGASAIPQDLKQTATLLQLGPAERWRTLVLPSLFPYIVTGIVTASGGAWNASIVAEYQTFAGETLKTVGVGALIAEAGADGNYPLLLAATLVMVVWVVLFNRLVWRRLYNLAEQKYRME